MPEEAWMDEGSAPPKKKGIPGWLWFCGGGCLLLFVAVAIAGVFVFKAVKEGTDPERQWSKLVHVLPFDQRGEHLTLNMGWSLIYDLFMLTDDRGYALMIYDLEPSQAADFREIFSTEFDGGGGVFGFGGIENPELGQVEVQGRMLPVQRFYQSGGDEAQGPAGGPKFDRGYSAFIDATPPDHVGAVVLMLIRTRSGDVPISDDEIRDVLAPFRIGPDYEPPPPPAAPAAELGGSDVEAEEPGSGESPPDGKTEDGK